MRKKILASILAMTFAVSLTACGVNKNDDNTPKETEKLEEKVVIYSTHPENLLEFVATKFEEETGVEVEFINLKGELADRVKAEKENPQADIMYGAASSVFLELKKDDLFESFEPTWANDLDPMFKDKDGTWYGTIQTPVMLCYNTEMLTEDTAPKDWSDLTKEEYKDLLVFRNGLSSSAKAMYASLLYGFDKENKLDDGFEFMKALDKNTKKYFNSESLQFQAIGRKEAAITFAPLSSIISNRDENNIPLEIVDAESGSLIITDGIAVIKNAPHKNAAEAFLEFAGSPEIQAELANNFNRMPTLSEALENSPAWMSENKYKAMDVDWTVLAEKQSTWIQKWDSEIKDASKDVE
ncbi:extracellular solute-binding protein [Clostridium sp. Sa3CUN1]|uniref:Extracellular solute-binding protein n=1 Tax=Clostridium gallinarum TaxID=2762246 RepID=A0ABR8Q4M6_9CLOT|nr:extracellular solute-binding protein [Clostridium gallinarum]MBD7915380.1 extracellular solute-binding protein [Clostridium gallinarum]